MPRPAAAHLRTRILALAGLAATLPACADAPTLPGQPACSDLYAEFDGTHDGVLLVCTDLGAPCPAADDPAAVDAVNAVLDDYDSDVSGFTTGVLDCGPQEIDGACCYAARVGQWIEGRPFLVDGTQRRAEARYRGGWSAPMVVPAPPEEVRPRLVRGWLEIARNEHASVPAFARAVVELTGLGAPAALVDATARAMQDEIVHARLAFGVAAALAGDELGPAPLSLDGVGLDADPARVLLATFREGCVGETVAAAIAAEAARGCAIPEVRGILARVADDETRHAALAWKTVRWLLAAHPHLRPLLDEALAGIPLRGGGAVDPALAAWGVLDDATTRRLAAEVLTDVVRPCLAALDEAPPALAA